MCLNRLSPVQYGTVQILFRESFVRNHYFVSGDNRMEEQKLFSNQPLCRMDVRTVRTLVHKIVEVHIHVELEVITVPVG